MKIKHLLTKKCHVGCKYCLEKNVHTKDVTSIIKIADKYNELKADGYNIIDLTGGEATMHPNFLSVAILASEIFDEAHLYTADHLQYNTGAAEDLFTTVNYGWHRQVPTHDLPEVKIGIPVYAQTMHYHYKEYLPQVLKDKGFSGLSINTDKHYRGVAFRPKIENLPNFSVRINDNDCYASGVLLMPNLKLVEDVGQYLDKNIA